MFQYTLKVEGYGKDLEGQVYLGSEFVGGFTASTTKNAEQQARAIAQVHARENAPLHRTKFERDFTV